MVLLLLLYSKESFFLIINANVLLLTIFHYIIHLSSSFNVVVIFDDCWIHWKLKLALNSS